MANLAYFSLGSNVGDRRGNLLAAIDRLRELARVIAVSGFYETEPVGLRERPWFPELRSRTETDESVTLLLKRALAIEQEMGRLRTRDKGPRTIDIDILLFGDEVVEEED
jgi:2-amino-4-hydroxy-6-hydroxymethyldihydropteridine diphosphokinase